MSRHTKPADDSRRLCVVISNSMEDGIKSNVGADRPSVSDVVRGYIMDGLYNDARKKERANERAKRRQADGVRETVSGEAWNANGDFQSEGNTDRTNHDNDRKELR